MNLELLEGVSGALLEGTRFNADMTRLCIPSSLGIACYRGMCDEKGQWHGTLVGIAPDEDGGQRFLDGAFVTLRSAG